MKLTIIFSIVACVMAFLAFCTTDLWIDVSFRPWVPTVFLFGVMIMISFLMHEGLRWHWKRKYDKKCKIIKERITTLKERITTLNDPYKHVFNLREEADRMVSGLPKDEVQLQNPKTKRYVKINRGEGTLEHKEDDGPFEDVPIKKKEKPILCVDFDGVIHSYKSGWQGPTKILDDPVQGAMHFLKDASEVFDVQIYSSRSKHPGGILAMQKYIEGWSEYFDIKLPELKYPTEKPPAFLTIDDRAWQFEGIFPVPRNLLNFKPWHERQYGRKSN